MEFENVFLIGGISYNWGQLGVNGGKWGQMC